MLFRELIGNRGRRWTLRQRGFGQGQAESIIAAMADLKATNRGANTQGIVEQIAQIQSLGRLTFEDLKPILQRPGDAYESWWRSKDSGVGVCCRQTGCDSVMYFLSPNPMKGMLYERWP